MDQQATTYEGGLKVFTDGEEWVIASDASDARAVWHENGASGYDDEIDGEWDECPPGKNFTLHEDDEGSASQTKTFAEWAKRGRGYLGSANY